MGGARGPKINRSVPPPANLLTSDRFWGRFTLFPGNTLSLCGAQPRQGQGVCGSELLAHLESEQQFSQVPGPRAALLW